MSVVPLKSLYNHLLAEWSVILSRLGVEYTSPMPTFLSVEPASICQLHCTQCPCGSGQIVRDTDDALLSLDLFRKILNDCSGWVHTIQFYFQGEPLLNPNLSQMIRMAHQAHIYTTCSTNAQALTPLMAEQLIQSGLDRIIVSIDGLSEESYGAYRQGGSLNKALKGLICLREAKDRLGGKTHIELQCLRLRSNEHEWAMFKRSYHQMGADSLSLKSAQFYDYQQGNPLMPSDECFSRYTQMPDGTYRPKNRLHPLVNQSCKRLLMGCVITTKGDVLPCCFDKSATHVMGNIRFHSLASVWRGNAFRLFRQQVRANRLSQAICCNCTES